MPPHAIVCARERHLGAEIRRGTLYTSDQAHHSVIKVAKLAGVMADRVRAIIGQDRQYLPPTRFRDCVEDISGGSGPSHEIIYAYIGIYVKWENNGPFNREVYFELCTASDPPCNFPCRTASTTSRGASSCTASRTTTPSIKPSVSTSRASRTRRSRSFVAVRPP